MDPLKGRAVTEEENQPKISIAQVRVSDVSFHMYPTLRDNVLWHLRRVMDEAVNDVVKAIEHNGSLDIHGLVHQFTVSYRPIHTQAVDDGGIHRRVQAEVMDDVDAEFYEGTPREKSRSYAEASFRAHVDECKE